jgi:hypothetical protein
MAHAARAANGKSPNGHVPPADSLSREQHGCEMDAPVICERIRDTFTYPLMLRLLACKGFSREALLPLQVRNAAA